MARVKIVVQGNHCTGHRSSSPGGTGYADELLLRPGESLHQNVNIAPGRQGYRMSPAVGIGQSPLRVSDDEPGRVERSQCAPTRPIAGLGYDADVPPPLEARSYERVS